MKAYDMNKKPVWTGECKNSDTCSGVAAAFEDAPVDMSIIEITGRYPDEGSWAINHESHEMVHITRGLGSIAIRGAEVQELQAGDVVHVAPGQYFAWDGDMELAMVCSPPFSPEQYEVVNEDELKGRM